MIKSKDMFLDEQEKMAANSGNGNSIENYIKERPALIIKNVYLNLTKEHIKGSVKEIVHSVSEGLEDPLDVLIMAKKGSELFTTIENNVKDYVYGKQYEKHSRHGCDIEPAQIGTKFDYSVCNDSVLVELEQKAKLANDAVKDRQNFLKAINGSATLVDTETGETYTAYPPIKTATSGYRIVIK